MITDDYVLDIVSDREPVLCLGSTAPVVSNVGYCTLTENGKRACFLVEIKYRCGTAEGQTLGNLNVPFTVGLSGGVSYIQEIFLAVGYDLLGRSVKIKCGGLGTCGNVADVCQSGATHVDRLNGGAGEVKLEIVLCARKHCLTLNLFHTRNEDGGKVGNVFKSTGCLSDIGRHLNILEVCHAGKAHSGQLMDRGADNNVLDLGLVCGPACAVLALTGAAYLVIIRGLLCVELQGLCVLEVCPPVICISCLHGAVSGCTGCFGVKLDPLGSCGNLCKLRNGKGLNAHISSLYVSKACVSQSLIYNRNVLCSGAADNATVGTVTERTCLNYKIGGYGTLNVNATDSRAVKSVLLDQLKLCTLGNGDLRKCGRTMEHGLSNYAGVLATELVVFRFDLLCACNPASAAVYRGSI